MMDAESLPWLVSQLLLQSLLLKPVLRIRDVYPGSRIQGSKSTRSRIPDPDPQHWLKPLLLLVFQLSDILALAGIHAIAGISSDVGIHAFDAIPAAEVSASAKVPVVAYTPVVGGNPAH
jgi:hypothetical protein